MELRNSDIRALQTAMKAMGLYNDTVDGRTGPNTLAASKAVLAANANRLPDGFESWPNSRTYAASYQIILTDAGHASGPIDGYYGPLTRNASVWFIREQSGVEVIDFEAVTPIDVNPNNFPKETTASLNAHYGTVNPPNSCPVPIVKVPSPWKMGLDWDMSLSRTHFNVHKKVADSLKRVLDAIFQHYGLDGIEKHGLNRFSGDLNCRSVRGGSRPSTHAWGIAIDFYGSKNELRRSTNDNPPPTLAHPELNFFWERWEEEGWYSLGRSEDRDWMHIQAAKGRRSKFFHN
jgi:hypothetical protein